MWVYVIAVTISKIYAQIKEATTGHKTQARYIYRIQRRDEKRRN